MNIVIITIIKELIFAPGISIKKLSTSKSPPKPLKTKENIDAPINIKKTIEGKVMDELKLHKICCRRHMLTHVDIIG